MKYLSLFSGIEAATVAWHPLGWEPVAFCEIDKFPSAVLAHRFPGVHNFGDVTAVTEEQIKALGRIDLVVFGSPCQDLSVAGKRKGLAGERSGLFHTAIQIIGWARKHCGLRWALWENVPGAFSSNAGADFAAVVEHLAGVALPVPAKGWGVEGVALGQESLVEWAVLDAQWFGVAQRRRRVFALADFGDWFSRCPVLLEPHSLRGNFAPSRGARKGAAGSVAPGVDLRNGAMTGDVAHTVQAGYNAPDPAGTPHVLSIGFNWQNAGGYGNANEGLGITEEEGTGPLQRCQTPAVAVCVTGEVTHTLKAEGFDASEDGTGRGQPIVFDPTQITSSVNRSNPQPGDPCHTLASGQRPPTLAGPQVRRVTPREEERLQGFPDDWTLIPWRGKAAEQCPDGPRYKALGNSMAVPVMRWIGERIEVAGLIG